MQGGEGTGMDRKEMEKMNARIKAIKEAADELKALSGGMQAVDRNVDRILASVRMLEINVSDLFA
jgi:hypothetical protein